MKNRKDIDIKYKWNTEAICESPQKAEIEIESYIDKYNKFNTKYKNNLDSAESIYNCLTELSELVSNFYALVVYVYSNANINTKDSTYQSLKSKADTIMSEADSKIAFIEPEIIKIGSETIKNYIAENEYLNEYANYLNKIVKNEDHVLSDSEEQLLSSLADILNASDNTYSLLANADVDFGDMIYNNEKITLTPNNYTPIMQLGNKQEREEAFNKVHTFFKKHENSIASMYGTQIKTDNKIANIRNYNSALESELNPKEIPISVYSNLVTTINNNLHLLHKYVELRKKALKVDEMHMYDIYKKSFKSNLNSIEFDECKDIILDALSPLGKEYLSILSSAFENRWMDVYPSDGKRSGAYSGGQYKTPPLVLLNYANTNNDVSTVAHELGHAIHSYYSDKNQNFLNSNYPIFLAEIASTLNETFLINYQLEKEQDINNKLFLLSEFLEMIKSTIFRQTQFAEFELLCHEKFQKGENLSASDFSNIYLELNKKYYGNNIVSDDLIAYEWARIPHFYTKFYVYQYATGLSAALSFYKMISEDPEKHLDNYLTLLKSGCSDYPLELLKKAGLDMSTPKPIEDALKVFEDLLNEFEILINKSLED
ncbi:MAG: oligoendopeptidase F [Clostridia bacterium]|nr:oligoendopeptidase F [Clostridia bacterium]